MSEKRTFEFWNAMEECPYYDAYHAIDRACKHKENYNGYCMEARCPLAYDGDEFDY